MESKDRQMETFFKQVFIIPLTWIKMEIFELGTPTVTQRRSVRPYGRTCFILFHHVLDLIFAVEQIVLDIIDVVCKKLLQAENRAAKESARLASRALLSLKTASSPQAKNKITELSVIDCAPKQRGQNLLGKLLIWALYTLLLVGSTPIGHPRSTETGSRCSLLIG
jgi:hypothetical protein